MGERRVRNAEVMGSNPTISTDLSGGVPTALPLRHFYFFVKSIDSHFQNEYNSTRGANNGDGGECSYETDQRGVGPVHA